MAAPPPPDELDWSLVPAEVTGAVGVTVPVVCVGTVDAAVVSVGALVASVGALVGSVGAVVASFVEPVLSVVAALDEVESTGEPVLVSVLVLVLVAPAAR